MQCPNCQQKTISFHEWRQRNRALRHTCPHCQTALKGNRTSTIWFVAALATLPFILVAFLYLMGDYDRGVYTLCAVVGFGTLCTLTGWKRGGYICAPQEESSEA